MIDMTRWVLEHQKNECTSHKVIMPQGKCTKHQDMNENDVCSQNKNENDRI